MHEPKRKPMVSPHDADREKRLHLYLIVILFAAAVYIGCMISPPSLMDDVDAVQAQIARNMLSFRRLGDRPTGRRRLS